MGNRSLSKRYLGFRFSLVTRGVLRIGQQTCLLVDITEVLQSLIRENLVHEIDTARELNIRSQWFNLNRSVFQIKELLDVLLVALGRFWPELAFYYKPEGVWHLRLACAYASDKARSVDADRLD